MWGECMGSNHWRLCVGGVYGKQSLEAGYSECVRYPPAVEPLHTHTHTQELQPIVTVG